MYGPSSAAPPRAMFKPRGHGGGQIGRPPIEDLPPHLRMMFEPRPIPLFVKNEKKKEYPPYSGISNYLALFETEAPIVSDINTISDNINKKLQLRLQKENLNKEKNDLLANDWDPHRNDKATTDAFSTLFVARLAYDTNEKKLKREFEQYGNIKNIRLVNDLQGKSRGYAFIEFESEEDMKLAYKRVDGKKIDGRRVIVDVERGRTVRNWRPLRLGGGLGGRKAKRSKRDIENEIIRNQNNLISTTITTNTASSNNYRGREDRRDDRREDRRDDKKVDRRDDRREDKRDDRREDRRPRSPRRENSRDRYEKKDKDSYSSYRPGLGYSDRGSDRQVDRQVDKPLDRSIDRPIDRVVDRGIDRGADRGVDRDRGRGDRREDRYDRSYNDRGNDKRPRYDSRERGRDSRR
mmetsp:Transcript_15244/g.13777  ORF Transcript_15244/g.13777 Transcript_15244/m.13777 type:complete len:407 (-) Transcript_15244:195-1415(-)